MGVIASYGQFVSGGGQHPGCSGRNPIPPLVGGRRLVGDLMKKYSKWAIVRRSALIVLDNRGVMIRD